MFDMKMLNDIIIDDIEAETLAVANEFIPSIRPLYTVNDRFGPELIASCVLFGLADIRLVITAGHVFNELQGSAVYLGGEKRLVQLKNRLYRTRSKNETEGDRYDLAFMELDGEALAIIGNVRFLQSGDLDPNDIAIRSHLYCMLGYPATKNTFIDYANYKAPQKPFIFSSNSPDISAYKRLDVLEETHILLNFERKQITNKSHDKLTAPKLHGMSGGGICRIREYSRVASLSGPSTKKLVGITIEGHPMHKVVMGVRISCVIEAIRTHYPHLSEKLPVVDRISAHINER